MKTLFELNEQQQWDEADQ